MNHGDIFLFIRIAVLIAVSAVHLYAWRILRRRLDRGVPDRSRFARPALAALMILMALPGAWIVFAGDIPLPGQTLVVMTAIYMAWNALILGVVLFFAGQRIAARLGSAADSGSTAGFPRQGSGDDRIRPGESAPAHDRRQEDRMPARSGTDTVPAADAMQSANVDPGRRAFLRQGVTGLTIISVSSPVIGGISGDDDFDVVHKTVRVKNLPKRVEGFRIAMISDIHSGPFMDKKDIDPYIARMNKLKPDAIVLPGDFIQNRNEEVEPVADALQKLEAPYGVYGSTGNHDYFADADYVSKELEHAGVRMLRNEHTVLDVDGAPLALIGLDDVRDGHPFDDLFRTAVEGLDARIPNVVLCHKPYYLEEASEWGVDLMVSGHTHGGQIVIARVFDTIITPAALISGYIEGLYRLDGTQLYVTRGIGTVGIPIRINCPPEVTVLTLQRA